MKIKNVISLFFVLSFAYCVSLYADINFDGRSSAVIIEQGYSRLGFAKANKVTGWSELSVVKPAGFDTADNWGEAYYDNVVISQQGSELPATTLVYSNSNAIVALSGATGDVTIYDTHQIYGLAIAGRPDTLEENLVYFKDGFTVGPTHDLTLNTPIPVTGKIDLYDTGTISLANDFYLGSNAYLTNGGYINGNGYSLVLSCSLVVPENKRLVFTGDTIVNGHGTTLYLEPNAYIELASNVTVTLKNIRIKNSSNPPIPAMISVASDATLALQNVELDQADDYYFSAGRLFIHNNVMCLGNSTFYYESSSPAQIANGSVWYFDKGTTFYYKPSVANNNLIRMYGKTSAMYFDGASLKTTTTGLQLRKGTLYLDNNVSIQTSIDVARDRASRAGAITNITTDSNPNINEIYSSSWDPWNNWYAVSGNMYGQEEIGIYGFNGSTLNLLMHEDPAGGGFPYYTVAWNPVDNGPGMQYLAAGTFEGLFVFNYMGGLSLGFVSGPPVGGACHAVAWRPDGQYIVEGKESGEVYVHEFSGGLGGGGVPEFSLPGPIYAFAWDPTGQYLLAGVGNQIYVYEFQLSGPPFFNFLNSYVSSASEIRSISFSPDGNYVAVGGLGSSFFDVFSFSASTGNLSPITNFPFSGGDIYSIDWNATSDKLLIGGDGSVVNLEAYSFANPVVTSIGTELYSGLVKTVESFPSWDYFGVAGQTRDVSVYSLGAGGGPTPEPQTAISEGLILGDSSIPDGNLDVRVLAAANVSISGKVFDDSTE